MAGCDPPGNDFPEGSYERCEDFMKRFAAGVLGCAAIAFAVPATAYADPGTPTLPTEDYSGCRFASISAECRWETLLASLAGLLPTGSAEAGPSIR
ncbi:hypothetical protein BO226_11075 [Rhodococcus sp. 2G]|nr:hypothetical protein BO226_11075 [Rhodococcus sp. 2G]